MPPIFSKIDPMITVAWSLSYEVFFYLLIPVVVSVFQLRKWKVNLRILFFILITLLGFIYYFYFEGPIRMLMFIAGIILFEKVNNKPSDKTIPFIGTLFFLLTLILIVLLMEFKIPNGEWWRTVVIYFGFFMLCYECFSWQSPSAKLFSFTPLRWFGNMSYSYYLTHGLTIKVSIMLFAQFFYTTSVSSIYIFITANINHCCTV